MHGRHSEFRAYAAPHVCTCRLLHRAPCGACPNAPCLPGLEHAWRWSWRRLVWSCPHCHLRRRRPARPPV